MTFPIQNVSFRKTFHELKLNSPEDTLEIFNMTGTFYWGDIDRYNYTSTTGPPYSLYTGLTLAQYSKLFLVLLIVQLASVLAVKLRTAVRRRPADKATSWFQVVLHALENTNIPHPWRDWDQDKGDIQHFRRRFKEVNREMFWTMMVNFVFKMLMLVPLWYTVLRIISRHMILKASIGTREDEDSSFIRGIILLRGTSGALIIFSVLEMGFYYLYNFKVTITETSVLHPVHIIYLFTSVPSLEKNPGG